MCKPGCGRCAFAISSTWPTTVPESMAGLVFGIITTPVMPPLIAASAAGCDGFLGLESGFAEMHVRIKHRRHQDAPGGIDDPRAFGSGQAFADLLDFPVGKQNIRLSESGEFSEAMRALVMRRLMGEEGFHRQDAKVAKGRGKMLARCPGKTRA
jgi:hypothetical protein